MAITVSEKNQQINYDQVSCYSPKPITKVPDYVFCNCNQITIKEYETTVLENLRKKTANLTKETLKKICPTKELYITKGEEYDWIHGLNKLELSLEKAKENPNYLEDNLTSALVLQCNMLFTRLVSKKPGAIRENPTCWRKHDFDVNELVVGYCIEEHLAKTADEKFFPSLSKTNSKASVKKNKNWVEAKLKARKNNSAPSDLTKKQIEQIDPRIVDQWLGEQNSKNDKLDLCAWMRRRYHYFPSHTEIQSELEQTLKIIKNKEMHPIAKAARIWFDIVKIHVFEEANKRTAKALASIILLAHGYLPPEIGSKEEAEEYFKVLINGFEQENGFEKFAQFMVEKIKKTQEKYRGKIPLDS